MSQESREKLKTGSLEEVFDTLYPEPFFMQWSRGVKVIDEDTVEIPFVAYFDSKEDADKAEQNLLAYGYSPQKQGDKILLTDRFPISEVRKLAQKWTFFCAVRDDIEGKPLPRVFKTREQVLNYLYEDFISLKTNFGFRLVQDDSGKKSELVDGRQFDILEKTYNRTGYGREIFSDILEFAPDVVDQSNTSVDILNTTNDILVYKRAVNKLVYLLKPTAGTNARFEEPEASALLFQMPPRESSGVTTT